MSNTYQMVEGVNDPLDVQLQNVAQSGGQYQAAQPFNATGWTISMTIETADGSIAPSVLGKVAWLNAAQSTVRYTPGVSDLKFSASPYSIRFIAKDPSGNSYAYPRTIQPDFINVGK